MGIEQNRWMNRTTAERLLSGDPAISGDGSVDLDLHLYHSDGTVVDASIGLGFVALGVPVYHWRNARRRFP